MKRTTPLVCAVAFFAFATAATVRAADDFPANPEYALWEHFKPGTTVVMTRVIDAGNLKASSDMVRKLVEVKPDKIVIEQSSVTTIAGQEHKSPPQQRDVLAREKKKVEMKETGTEEIEAGGKKYKCKVMEGEADMSVNGGKPAGKVKSKVWINDAVPGGAVKMTIDAPTGAITFVLKSIDEK